MFKSVQGITSVFLALLLFAGCARENEEVAKLRTELEKLKQERKQDQLAKEVKTLTTTRINGSVFIATRGGTSYKLGMVQVGIIDQDKYAEYIARFSSAANEHASKQATVYDAAVRRTAQAFERASSALKEYVDAQAPVAALKVNLERECDVFISEPLEKIRVWSDRADRDIPAVRRFIEARNALAPLGRKAKPLYDDLVENYNLAKTERSRLFTARETVEGEAVFIGIPTHATTKTDADGNFTLLAQRPVKAALVARAERAIGGEIEKYFWITPVNGTTEDDELRIMLSNDNHLPSVSPLEIRPAIEDTVRELPERPWLNIVSEPLQFKIEDENRRRY